MPSQVSPAPRPPRTRGGPDRLLDLTRHLTARDRYLLRMLADHRVLTTSMINDLAFGHLRLAQRRLATLHHLGLIERFRAPRTAGSEPWRYVLAPAGAEIVAHEQDRTPPPASKTRARARALAHNPRLGHLLGINAFFTSLAGHGRTTGGQAGLLDWWPEHHCARAFAGHARPDGYGIWHEHRRQVEFCLEYDTGTERPIRRVLDKLPGYRDLSIALDRPVLVLFRFPGSDRENHLHNALEASCGGVRIATAHPALGPPHEAVWRLDGHGGRWRLADLATSHESTDRP